MPGMIHEEELAQWEAKCHDFSAGGVEEWWHDELLRELVLAVPALITEVRQLRALQDDRTAVCCATAFAMLRDAGEIK